MLSLNNEGHNTWGETATITVAVSVTCPETLLRVYKSYFAHLEIYFFIPVISGHLTFAVETSTRSQDVVQRTPSDNTHYLRIMKVSI